jgi:Peptidase family M28
VAADRESGTQRILLSAVMLAAIFCFSLQGLQPPAPKALSASPDRFSAGRALAILTRLLGNEAPHLAGSAPNTAVRQRILREFSQNNYVPKVETAFVCGHFGTCATVNNVVARVDGREKGAVLLAAHYDSVPVSPGASDDGAGAATVLEIARALKSLPAPLHSIIFLVDDGEEAGMLGARAFVQSDPWAKEVKAAVNLDARGTSGPSLMFETGNANAWAARLYAKSATHPVTSSIFYTVYKQLPNDTDFTVFKSAGYEGLNFAFIDNVAQYHTPLDNIANASPASMQHQGENALASVLAFANADFSRIPQADAVYFDVFGYGVVRAPARWMLFLAMATILLIGFEMGALSRSGRVALRQLIRGLCAWILTVAGAAVLAFILQRLLQLAGAISVNWIAHPAALEASFWFLAIGVAITLGVLFARGCGFWGLWAGTWTWWALLSLATAWEAKGISYVLLVPAAAAALSALPATLRRSARLESILTGVAVFLPLAASGIVGFATVLLLYDGLGSRALPGICALVALLFTPILPLCVDFLKITSGRGVAIFWAPVVVTFAAAFTSILMPAVTATAPERVNLEYWKDADSGKSQWIVQPVSGRLPEPMLASLPFKRAEKGPFPWDFGPAFLAPAHGLSDPAPAPTLTILESKAATGWRNYRALLRSERGASEVMALFPPGAGVTMVRMNDQAVEGGGRAGRPFFGGWNVYRCVTTPAGGVEVDFSLPAGKPLEVYAVDATYGLPVEGKFLIAARPSNATPSQDGDVTMVSRRVQLIP